MEENHEQYDEEMEIFEDTFILQQEAGESLLNRTNTLCTDLHLLVQNIITEAQLNTTVQKKLSRNHLPESFAPTIKRNRITIEVDAPDIVYFYSAPSISDIIDMYWDEEFMQDITNN